MVLGTAGKNNENFTTFHHVIESVTLRPWWKWLCLTQNIFRCT
jgi:hypothetical protein